MTRDASVILKNAMQTLRELQLHLNFFNLGFANVLWACKLSCLSTTILAGFSAIRLMHTNPVFGCLYTYLFLLFSILYIGMYGFAYKVTEKLEDLTKLMEILSAGLTNSKGRKYWTMVLRSIPRMGMTLGGFNRVEREAIPIFIDFSVGQIVSLLLAFP